MFPQKCSGFVENLGLIEEAIFLLTWHSLIGRPSKNELRGLVISRGDTGYIALYSFEEKHDAIFVLGIRHRREAGYEE